MNGHQIHQTGPFGNISENIGYDEKIIIYYMHYINSVTTLRQ